MRRALLIAGVLLCATSAAAHKPSDSYLTLQPAGAHVDARWDIALRDLEQAIGLDADHDGAITWGEVRAQQDTIAAYALARLQVEGDGSACRRGLVALSIDRHTDGAYAVLRLGLECEAAPRALGLRYGLFFEFDPQHRGVLRVVDDGGTRTLLFTAGQTTQQVELALTGAWQNVRDSWRTGVWHIWEASDHILFLLALLLPAVLRRDSGRWHPVGWRTAFVNTLEIVTAFALAHSITLSLAALGIVHASTRWVETGIAASIVLAALNNAYPIFPNRRWMIGFAFGLLHGLGLASVLADPTQPIGSLLAAMVGFNAGVETGQLAIVGAFLPLAYLVRRSWLYQRVTLVVGSSLIALLATIWTIERALDLQLL